MGFFRRKQRVDVGTYEPAEAIPPAPIERVVEEGLLIATTAVRMQVKNHIIMDAIQRNTEYDPIDLAAVARDEFEVLAKQNDSFAYKQTEDRYIDIHRSLAEALRKAAHDTDKVAGVVEQAREQAWNEVGSAIVAKLARAGEPGRDPDYEREKQSRLRTLIAVDLATLSEESRDTY
ncbi:hypothetical protein [Salinibacterium sp. ZJ454]|uniref:hypothetical protein n=1 Tax=Salinibacterium sp. ZJ454 TaxID=2708339 RepID=UPI00142336D5|nr:hypothetical protein [Salinibacterium sp. ZJ454]